MSIKKLYKTGKPVISFEVFPPKKDEGLEEIYGVLRLVSRLSPEFISVTCGAGGSGNAEKTIDVAAFISEECKVNSLAHMTCIGAKCDKIDDTLDKIKSKGIENILALRGDIPKGEEKGGVYSYAEELIKDIRSREGLEHLSIGAACYPEGHIECEDSEIDLRYLLKKQEAGADFFITQLFFDNNTFFSFLERARAIGITKPISAGVMPILSKAQIERMIFLCGASLPTKIIKILHKYADNKESLRKAGIEHAAIQTEDLIKQGAEGVHVYVMNNADIAESIMSHIGRA